MCGGIGGCLYWRKGMVHWDLAFVGYITVWLTTNSDSLSLEHYFSNGGQLSSLYWHGFTSITVFVVMLVYKIIHRSLHQELSLCNLFA
jgi:hypothetical protein